MGTVPSNGREMSAFCWNRATSEREMCLSAGSLALRWDTLLGVLFIRGTPKLEAQETLSSRLGDDGVPGFDLLIHVCSVIHL